MTREFWINFGLPVSIVAFAGLVTWLAGIWSNREDRAIDAMRAAEEAAKRDARPPA